MEADSGVPRGLLAVCFTHLGLLVFGGVFCFSSWCIALLLLIMVYDGVCWVLFRFVLLWLYWFLGRCFFFTLSPVLFLVSCSFHVFKKLCVVVLLVGCEGFQFHGFGVMLQFPNIKMLQVPRLASFLLVGWSLEFWSFCVGMPLVVYGGWLIGFRMMEVF